MPLRSNNPITLESDRLDYDRANDVIEATGSVLVMQDGRKLEAEQIIYRLRDNFAYAQGHVVLTDATGERFEAETIELNDEMRKGLIEGLYAELADGSRLWAKRAVRETPTKHYLKTAQYTPCKPCQDNPDAAPFWSLRAEDVTHDKEKAEISYKNARFELAGVPVFYTPYFFHPDGSVKQKSGFLTPDMGYSSDFGLEFEMPYYWAISPSMDMTAGVRFFSKETPQLNLETRKRFNNASLEVRTSMTSSSRTDSVSGQEISKDDEFRGHVEASGLWAINKNWRAGADIALASDEQYLEQYDISSADVLDNRLYVERFDQRDYASVQLLAFQDLRVNENIDQPNALPYANMEFIGSPNSVLGGRFAWDASLLSLFREGDEQDMNRLSSSVDWQKRSILPLGFVNEMELSVRGDVYHTQDRTIAQTNPTQDDEKTDTRFIPTAHTTLAYPLQKTLSTSQIKIKPKISVTLRPDVDNDSDIPNEDSTDAQIDATNIFESDRFPGLDRVEDRGHVSYGTEFGLYQFDGDEVSMFLGQSYRFEDSDNPFQNGSGLETQTSDIVGQMNLSLDQHRHNLNYRFQMDGESFNIERHEVYAGTEYKGFEASAIYLYERGNPGTEFTESREQIYTEVSQQLTNRWKTRASILYDLGTDQGMRESKIGLDFEEDCFAITATLERDLQSDSSGSNDTTVKVNLRLKNLGEFETQAYESSQSGGAN